jgi:hypothetical protein
MQAAIDRVMQTYGMMANLTPVQEAVAREKVSHFLKDKGGDEHSLAVEGLKYLLGHVTKPRRQPDHLSTASSSFCGS